MQTKMSQDVARWGKESPTPGQLKELFAQIGSGRVTRTQLQSLLNGGYLSPSNDMRKEGWDLLENQKGLVISIDDLAKIELLTFLNDGEESIGGKVMMTRSERLEANLSQVDLEAICKILKENPNDPRVKTFLERIDNRCLVATKTVWRDRNRSLLVAFLNNRFRDEWRVSFEYFMLYDFSIQWCFGRLLVNQVE